MYHGVWKVSLYLWVCENTEETVNPFPKHSRCSVLQCVAVCCSVLQCGVACCSVLQCVAVCCSVLQCVAVWCSVLQCVAVCCSALQCAAVRCSVLQCVAVCCIMLQCIAVFVVYVGQNKKPALPSKSRHAIQTRATSKHKTNYRAFWREITYKDRGDIPALY